jgi:hypothetical protein
VEPPSRRGARESSWTSPRRSPSLSWFRSATSETPSPNSSSPPPAERSLRTRRAEPPTAHRGGRR